MAARVKGRISDWKRDLHLRPPEAGALSQPLARLPVDRDRSENLRGPRSRGAGIKVPGNHLGTMLQAVDPRPSHAMSSLGSRTQLYGCGSRCRGPRRAPCRTPDQTTATTGEIAAEDAAVADGGLHKRPSSAPVPPQWGALRPLGQRAAWRPCVSPSRCVTPSDRCPAGRSRSAGCPAPRATPASSRLMCPASPEPPAGSFPAAATTRPTSSRRGRPPRLSAHSRRKPTEAGGGGDIPTSPGSEQVWSGGERV